MLEIMREKEKIVAGIFIDTEKKLEEILSKEFKEFDVVKVTSHPLHDELELHKDGKSVRLRLTTKRYDGKIKRNVDGEEENNKGLFFRKSGKNVEEFNEKEFKIIQRRLQALYESRE